MKYFYNDNDKPEDDYVDGFLIALGCFIGFVFLLLLFGVIHV